MITRIRISTAAVAAATLVVLGTIIGASTARAQYPWNPPCPTMTVVNNSPCFVIFNMATMPLGGLPIVVIPPGGRVVLPTGGPMTLIGPTSMAGITYAMVPGPGPGQFWAPGVITGPAPGCCLDYIADNTTCTVTIMPGTPPCRP